MKIAFFETAKREQAYLKEKLKGHKITFFKGEITLASAKKVSDAEVIGVFIYSKVSKKILDLFPKLKLVTTMSTGFNHIDLEECKKRKITVTNVPTYGENTVAEHTFALILALSRKIHYSYERTKVADFSAQGLEGFDLKEKTIGIVGCGHIGRHVVRIAKGFEMNVLVYEKNPDKNLAKKLGFKNVALNYLYKNSDIISFHVPLFPSTKHMLNSKTLTLLKKGCMIINTARGEIIETDALIKGLSKGIIGSAGLDVLEGECFIREEKQVLDEHFSKECDLRAILKNHLLLKQKNVLITPHNAFNSFEAIYRILDTTIKNISDFSKGKKINKVD